MGRHKKWVTITMPFTSRTVEGIDAAAKLMGCSNRNIYFYLKNRIKPPFGIKVEYYNPSGEEKLLRHVMREGQKYEEQ